MIIHIRSRNGGDPIRRKGGGQQARKIRERIGGVARQVLINAAQTRADFHIVAGVHARAAAMIFGIEENQADGTGNRGTLRHSLCLVRFLRMAGLSDVIRVREP